MGKEMIYEAMWRERAALSVNGKLEPDLFKMLTQQNVCG